MYYHNHILRSEEIFPATAFVYKVDVVSGDTIQLPMISTDDSLYNFTVDYGDGSPEATVTAYSDTGRTHQYTTTGKFNVVMDGQVDYILFNDDKSSVIELKQFGNGKVGSSSFYLCPYLNILSATDTPDMHSGNSLVSCFRGSPFITVNESVNNWNVSGITNFFRTFADSSCKFNAYIGDWDVSNATLVASMFQYNNTFNQDISNWTLNTSPTNMFQGTTSFNNGGQPMTWTLGSGVTNMSYMFNSADAFNVDISSWDVSNVNTMQNMFDGANAFNQDISSWDISSVSNLGFTSMFRGTNNFNNGGQPLTGWTMTQPNTSLSGMFQSAKVFNVDISSWDVSNVNNMQTMFLGADAFNQDISNWNVSGVTTMIAMFNSADAFNNGGVALDWADTSSLSGVGQMFQSAISFNQDISSWDVSNVNNTQWMFSYATSFNQDISSWDVSNLVTTTSMFQNAYAFNNGGVELDWADTSSLVNMQQMFENATGFSQNVSGWTTSGVTNMAGVFSGATAFDHDIGMWDITSLSDATNMFNGVTLSTTNYDALLIGWEGQTEPTDIVFHGGNSTYSAGAPTTARGVLTATSNWNITDGGQA